MRKRLLSLLLAGTAALLALSPRGYALTPELDIISDTYCVMEAASGRVLIEKGMNKQKAPAIPSRPGPPTWPSPRGRRSACGTP